MSKVILDLVEVLKKQTAETFTELCELDRDYKYVSTKRASVKERLETLTEELKFQKSLLNVQQQPKIKD